MPGMLMGPDQAQPARACPDHVDPHAEGAGPARGQGGRHGGGLSRDRLRGSIRRRGADELPRPVAQLHGTRQGAVRRPRGRRGGGDLEPAIAEAGARPDRGRVRGAAARHRRRGRDGRTRRCCTTTSSPPASSRNRRQPRTSPSGSTSSKATSTQASRGRGDRRAALYDQAGAPGLYRAACLRRFGQPPTARRTIWSSSQGQFMVRAYCAKLLGIDMANIRAIPAEIGGGFGGKTLVYLEPVALALSQKSGRPVKIVMSREEVFRATGPTSGGVVEVKLGAKSDGTHGRGRIRRSSSRPAPSRARRSRPGCMCGFAMYDIPNVNIIGYDVVSQPAESRRLPGARRADLDLRGRELHGRAGARTGDRSARAARDQRGQRRHQGGARADLGQYRLSADAGGGEGARAPEDPLGPNQGRGIASGFWFNVGGEFERRRPRQRGRHRRRRRGQPRYRRLARLDGDDGGRGAGHPVRAGAAGRRRHGRDRLSAS